MPKTRETGLRAVLFTDVVGSTELAREMGDERWSRLLGAQRRVLRARIKANGGREVDTAGDGFFAVFERPADAIRCGFDACTEVQELGLDIRAGVHFGEVEIAGAEVHGVVVHTGARVMGHAGAAEVLITATVRDLVAGATIETAERGSVELKGVPGVWVICDVLSVDDRLRPQPIEGASVASERRDRAAAAPAPRRRRAPWIWVTAAAALLLVGGIVVATRPDPVYVPTSGTVVRIDADGTFDEPVPLASFPTGMAWGEGRLWVTDQQGQIYWLDPATGETGSRGAAGVPTGVIVGGGSVWVTNGFGVGGGPLGGVSRLDPVSEALEPAFSTPVGSEAIAWGADRVWVAEPAQGSVESYDPSTRSGLRIALVEGADPVPEASTIAYGAGALWVGDAAAGRVFRLSATSGAPEAFTVPAAVSALAVGAGGVWVAEGEADAAILLDPQTGTVVTSIPLAEHGCDRPDSIAVAEDAVWIGCSISGVVLRIDPDSKTVTRSLRLEGAPAALVSDGDGAIWVAVRPV